MSSSALKRLSAVASIVMVAALITTLPSSAAPAPRGESEPAVAGQAWYWETQQIQEVKDPVGNTHTISGPNPFCPSAPGDLGAPGQTCAQGRLPVEVLSGDYTAPDKISAVNFDFSLIPLGSKISKFEVTFLEAKGGCYDEAPEGPGPEDECERTDAINVADHKLQACQVNDFFGNGSARPYKEAPKYECAKSDPVAERKEEELKGTDKPLGEEENPDHTWTFDLTPLAKKWVSGTVQPSIMIFPNPPEGYNEDSPPREDSWRVVFAGPEAVQGVVTSLKFTAPATPVPPPPTDPTDPGVDTPVDTTTDFGSDFGTDAGTDTSTDFGTDTGSDPTGTGTDTTSETGADDTTETAAEAPGASPESFPAYMWLAILAGIIGFSLVRSTVIESTTGIRPNGVIAQIRSLNARGSAAAEAAPEGSAGGVASALGAVGHGFSSFSGKLKSIFRRG